MGLPLRKFVAVRRVRHLRRAGVSNLETYPLSLRRSKHREACVGYSDLKRSREDLTASTPPLSVRARTPKFIPSILQIIFVVQSAVCWRHRHSFSNITFIPRHSFISPACRSPTGSEFYLLTYSTTDFHLAIFIIIIRHECFRFCFLSQ